jgi:hypothetical protein
MSKVARTPAVYLFKFLFYSKISMITHSMLIHFFFYPYFGIVAGTGQIGKKSIGLTQIGILY